MQVSEIMPRERMRFFFPKDELELIANLGRTVDGHALENRVAEQPTIFDPYKQLIIQESSHPN